MSAAPKTAAESPNGSTSAVPKTAGKSGNHRAVISANPVELASRPDATRQTPSAPRDNFAAYIPKLHDPCRDEPEIEKSAKETHRTLPSSGIRLSRSRFRLGFALRGFRFARRELEADLLF